MAITFVAAGAASAANGANITPAMPAGFAAGDLLVCAFACRSNATATISSGWTSLFTSGPSSTSVQIQVWYRVAVAGDTSPTLTFATTNATDFAQIAAFRGTDVTGSLIDVLGTDYAAGANVTNIGAIPGVTPTRAGDLFICIGARADDWTGVATLSGDVTWVEIGEPASTLGTDAGMVWDYAIDTGTTTVASKTFTVTGGASNQACGRMVAIKAATVGPGAGTDTGSAADAQSLTAAVPTTDTATASEAATVAVYVSSADPVDYGPKQAVTATDQLFDGAVYVEGYGMFVMALGTPSVLYNYPDKNDLTNFSTVTLPATGYYNNGLSLIYDPGTARLYAGFEQGPSNTTRIRWFDVTNLSNSGDFCSFTTGSGFANAAGRAYPLVFGSYVYVFLGGLSGSLSARIFRRNLSDGSAVDSLAITGTSRINGHAFTTDGTRLYFTGTGTAPWVGWAELDMSAQATYAPWSNGDFQFSDDIICIGTKLIGNPESAISTYQDKIIVVNKDLSGYSTISIGSYGEGVDGQYYDGSLLWVANNGNTGHLHGVNLGAGTVDQLITLDSTWANINEIFKTDKAWLLTSFSAPGVAYRLPFVVNPPNAAESQSVSQPTTPVSSSDANGTTTEASTLAAQIAAPDANATTTESAAPKATPAVSDVNGATTESGVPIAHPTSADTATAADAATEVARPASSDNATAAEATGLLASVPASDVNGATTETGVGSIFIFAVDVNGAVTESALVSTHDFFSSSDIGSGADVATLNAAIPAPDANGVTTEATTLTASVATSDVNGATTESGLITKITLTTSDASGTFTEAQSLVAKPSSADTGTITEGASGGGITPINSSDTGTASTESASVTTAQVGASDSASGTDQAARTALLASQDTAVGADAIALLSAKPSSSDSGSGIDTATMVTHIGSSDTGTTIETTKMTISTFDSGTTIESAIIPFVVILAADSASTVEGAIVILVGGFADPDAEHMIASAVVSTPIITGSPDSDAQIGSSVVETAQLTRTW